MIKRQSLAKPRFGRVNRNRKISLRYVLMLCCVVCTIVIATVIIAVVAATTMAAAAATIEEQEQVARELKIELSHLGSSSDPLEREALLLRITRECPDVEDGQAAYWSLSDLYLDDFTESDETRAREILEKFLKKYPSSRWTTQVKCRLLALCERGEDTARASQLRSELLKNSDLPRMIRVTIQ